MANPSKNGYKNGYKNPDNTKNSKSNGKLEPIEPPDNKPVFPKTYEVKLNEDFCEYWIIKNEGPIENEDYIMLPNKDVVPAAIAWELTARYERRVRGEEKINYLKEAGEHVFDYIVEHITKWHPKKDDPEKQDKRYRVKSIEDYNKITNSIARIIKRREGKGVRTLVGISREEMKQLRKSNRRADKREEQFLGTKKDLEQSLK